MTEQVQQEKPKRDIEREQVELVFHLGGGELEDEPWKFDGGQRAYWFDGVPDYAQEDERRLKKEGYGDFRTVVETGRFMSSSEVIKDLDGTEWKLVREFSSSGETECPFRDHPDRKKNIVLTEDTIGGEHENKWCALCEAEIGEEHGYIYLGESAELIYAVKCTHPDDQRTEQGDGTWRCWKCDTKGLPPPAEAEEAE